MNLSTIEMSKDEAREALAEWAASSTAEDEAIRAGYRELARGRRLISLSGTIRAGGEDELGRPRLAVAPALARTIYLSRLIDGTVSFSDDDRRELWRCDLDAPVGAGRITVRRVLTPLENPGWELRRDLERFGYKAIVPVVPPRFRTRGWKSAHVLFEVEWAKHTPPVPIDPALIRHLRGDLWVVRGVWDLTPLERAVLMERNRG